MNVSINMLQTVFLPAWAVLCLVCNITYWKQLAYCYLTKRGSWIIDLLFSCIGALKYKKMGMNYISSKKYRNNLNLITNSFDFDLVLLFFFIQGHFLMKMFRVISSFILGKVLIEKSTGKIFVLCFYLGNVQRWTTQPGLLKRFGGYH